MSTHLRRNQNQNQKTVKSNLKMVKDSVTRIRFAELF